MTAEELKKGNDLVRQIEIAKEILAKITKYENVEAYGQFVLNDYYRIDIPVETAKEIAMFIKIKTSAKLEQLKKEFEQLGKE